MNTTKELMIDLSNLVELLEHIKHRPGMYFGNDVDAMIAFLNGFTSALKVVGLNKDAQIYDTIVRERGWYYSISGGCWNAMLEQQKDIAFIVEEVFDIEIEAWQKTYNIN